MCEHCKASESDPDENNRVIVTGVTEVTKDHFTLCITGTDGKDGDEREMFGHYHFRVDKHKGDDGFIHIIDADGDGETTPGVSVPNHILHAFTMFMSHALHEDPTLVMTNPEKAQHTADTLIAAYHQHTN